MNFEKYVEATKRLKKYNLLYEVGYVDDFIYSLNKRQLNNFIKLNVPVCFAEKYKDMLIDKDFLNNKNYISIIDMMLKPDITNPDKFYEDLKRLFSKVTKEGNSSEDIFYKYIAIDEKKIDWLYEVSVNQYALAKKENMKYIKMIQSSSYSIAECIKNILCCPYNNIDNMYVYDIDLIRTSKSDSIAYALELVATDYLSINKPYHKRDMDLIANAKTNKIATYLSIIATNTMSLNSKYHLLHMDAIANSKDNITASILFHMIIDEEMQNTMFHEKEINYILNAKTDIHLKYLCNLIFDPNSRKNPLYLSNLDIISNCEDENYIEILVKAMQTESHNIEAKYKQNEEVVDFESFNNNEIEINFIDGEENKKTSAKKMNNN